MHIYIVLQQIITVTVAAADNYSFFFVSGHLSVCAQEENRAYGKEVSKLVCLFNACSW